MGGGGVRISPLTHVRGEQKTMLKTFCGVEHNYNDISTHRTHFYQERSNISTSA